MAADAASTQESQRLAVCHCEPPSLENWMPFLLVEANKKSENLLFMACWTPICCIDATRRE